MLHQGQEHWCGHCPGPTHSTRDQPSSLCLWAAQGTDELTGRLTRASILIPAATAPRATQQLRQQQALELAQLTLSLPAASLQPCSSPSTEMHTRSYVYLQTPTSASSRVVCPPTSITLSSAGFSSLHSDLHHALSLLCIVKKAESREQNQAPIYVSSYHFSMSTYLSPSLPVQVRLLSVSGARLH